LAGITIYVPLIAYVTAVITHAVDAMAFLDDQRHAIPERSRRRHFADETRDGVHVNEGFRCYGTDLLCPTHEQNRA